MPKSNEKQDWDKLRADGIRIKHFRNGNNLVGTIVYREKDGFVAYGVAIPSPKERPTSEMGRNIAYGRFKKAVSNHIASFFNFTMGEFEHPIYADEYKLEDFKNIFSEFYGTTRES